MIAAAVIGAAGAIGAALITSGFALWAPAPAPVAGGPDVCRAIVQDDMQDAAMSPFVR